MLEKIASWATHYFPLWSLLIAFLALYDPSLFLWYGKDAIGYGLGIIMLGMGMTLKVEDFILVWKSPFLIGLGVILQFLIMPAWGSFLALSLSLPKEIAVGLILVSCCPGGTASNVVVFLARANVALSLSLTLMSTLLAVVITPWFTEFYAGHYVPVDAWALLKSIVLIVLLPLLFGLVWKKFFKRSGKYFSQFSPLLSVIFILLIVGYVLAAKKNIILENWTILLCAVCSLHAGGFSFGYLLSKIFKRNKIECRTLAIEVGMQNSGLGMALASKHFPLMPMVPSPCALSAVVHCLIGSFLAVLWKKR